MGMTTMPKMRPICCGLTLVPMIRPSAPAVRLASARTSDEEGPAVDVRVRPGWRARSRRAGRRWRRRSCSAGRRRQIFSMATAATGSGHMTRSSISRVMPNSCASGRATAAMPENMMATAMSPGRRTVEKLAAGHGGGGVHGGAAAHVRHDEGEDEEEEQRVHADADEEGEHFAAQDVEVAQEEAGEGAGVLHASGGRGAVRRCRRTGWLRSRIPWLACKFTPAGRGR